MGTSGTKSTIFVIKKILLLISLKTHKSKREIVGKGHGAVAINTSVESTSWNQWSPNLCWSHSPSIPLISNVVKDRNLHPSEKCKNSKNDLNELFKSLNPIKWKLRQKFWKLSGVRRAAAGGGGGGSTSKRDVCVCVRMCGESENRVSVGGKNISIFY